MSCWFKILAHFTHKLPFVICVEDVFVLLLLLLSVQSLPPADMSANSTGNDTLLNVCRSRATIYIFTALIIIYIVLLPVFIFILFMGYQRWKKQRSVSVTTLMSPFDVLTYNMVVLELATVVGALVNFYSTYIGHPGLLVFGMSIYMMAQTGQTLFHLLTCVERYLAVVHPITYWGLRQARGVRIRNGIVGCVWVICFGSLGLLGDNHLSATIVYNVLLLVPVITVVSFCSLSILCTLIGPGPGSVGRRRERFDQSKQRAFNIIVAVMGALLLRFLSSVVLVMLSASVSVDYCLTMCVVAWLSLPSSLVLPLLFLHRTGLLPGC